MKWLCFVAYTAEQSTTSDQCSPHWVVYQNQAALYARDTGQPTQQRCLHACSVYPNCTAAEWGTVTGCWLHYAAGFRDRSSRPGVTQFEIVRECETSGTAMLFISL